MSTIGSGTDVVVGMELQVARDAFARDLAGLRAEFESWRQGIASQVLEIPVRLRNDATAQLSTLMQQLQAQAAAGISIPVNVGGGGGSGFGGSPLALAGAGGGGGPGVMGGAGAVGGSSFFNNQQMLAFQQNAFSSSSSSVTNIYNPANPAGGGGGSGMLSGSIRALSLLHFGRYVAEEYQSQNAPWQRIREDALTASASAQAHDVAQANASESTGIINSIASPFRNWAYGYDASQTATDILTQNSSIDRMDRIRSGRFAVGQAGLQSEADQDLIAGRSGAANEANRTIRRNQAVEEATLANQRRGNITNESGRREAAAARLNAANNGPLADDDNAPGATVAERFANALRSRQIAAQSEYDATIRSITSEVSVNRQRYQAENKAAQDAYDLDKIDEQRKNTTADLRSNYSVRGIGREADNALSTAGGNLGSNSEQLRRYNEDLKAHIDLLRETAKSQDDVTAARTRAQATAEDNARGPLVEARGYQLTARSDAGTAALSDMASSARATMFRMTGNALGASAETANQSKINAMTALGAQRSAGAISDSGYASGAQSIDASLLMNQVAAQQMEALRALSVRSAVNGANEDNPYESRRMRIRDDFERNRLTDSAHIGDYEQERDAELARVSRTQARVEGAEIFRNRGAAMVTNLTHGNASRGIQRNPQLAGATALRNQEVEELTGAKGAGMGDDVLRSIRDRYRAEAENLLRRTADPQARWELGVIRSERVSPLPINNRGPNNPTAGPNNAAVTNQAARAVDKFDKLMDLLLKKLK